MNGYSFDLALTGGLYGYQYSSYGVSVSTFIDMGVEGPEDFHVSLSNPVNVQLASSDPLLPTSLTVWITDPQGAHAPEFQPDEYVFNVQDYALLGETVGQVFATDPDPGDVLTYSGGDGSFVVQPDGTITIDSAAAASGGTTTFTVTVTDSTGLIDTAEVTITFGVQCGVVGAAEILVEEWRDDTSQYELVVDALDEFSNLRPNATVLDFGATVVGSSVARTVRITNEGSTYDLFLFDTDIPDGYSIPGGIPKGPNDTVPHLAWNETVVFDIQLDAVDAGVFSSNITIQNNDGDVLDPDDERPFEIAVHGVVDGPEITVFEYVDNVEPPFGTTMVPVLDDLTIVDFGAGTTGSPETRYFQLSNTGTQDLSLGVLTLPIGFSSTLMANQIVTPGQTIDFEIEFSVLGGGSYTGDFSLVTNDDNESVFDIALAGIVDEPELFVELVQNDGSLVEISSTGGVVDFGAIFVGSSAITRDVVISNIGLQTLDISHWYGPLGGDFTVSGLTDPTLWPGASQTVSITFDSEFLPTGNYSDVVYYSTNDVDEHPLYLTLSGDVVTPEITVTILDDGHFPIGSPVIDGSGGEDLGFASPGTPLTRFVEVRNDGTASLLLEPAVLSGDAAFSVVSNFTTSQAVAPGETAGEHFTPVGLQSDGV